VTWRCSRCSLCCAAFTLSRVAEEDVDRLGREFFVRDGNAWAIRKAPRSWAPWAKDGVCVFLQDDLRCSVHDEKPGLCANWSCVDQYGTRAKLEYAKSMYVRVPGEEEPDARTCRERYRAVTHGWLPWWYGPSAPGAPPLDDMIQRSPWSATEQTTAQAG